jgi:hypothetical protein
MITYWCNYTGPINPQWLAENGSHWAGGRIDISGTGDMFGESMGLPIMHTEDWNAFSRWLRDISTDEVWTLDQLVGLYEQKHSPIRWFNKDINAISQS